VTEHAKRGGAWSAGPVIDWLLREGRLLTDPVELADRLAAWLLGAGAPLWRMRLGFFTIHPQLAAWAHVWTRGQPTQVERIPYGVQRTGAYIGSPAQQMVESGRPVRHRLDRLSATDHRLLHELAGAGGRDYLLLPLQFSDGSRNVMAVATDRARGFSARDVENFEKLSHALATVLEVAATHRVAETLLDTYIGHRTGRRILSGQIHRGQADVIDAAIWYADLRDFTALTETLPSDRLLDLLNSYFELVAVAVTPRGGEILRFMGDAMLIIFPAGKQGELGSACAAAMDAALDAFERAQALNRRRC
jgi:adenylate cyclase